MKTEVTSEVLSSRVEQASRPRRRICVWGVVAVVLLLAYIGMQQLVGYYQRRIPLVANWAEAFQRSDTSVDGLNLVLAAGVIPIDVPEDMVVWRLDGERGGDWFGFSVEALGDVTGDGVVDFAVGAHQNENWGVRPAPLASPGYVHVISGSDGKFVRTLTGTGSSKVDGADDHFGYAVASIADIDHDGVPDVAVGAYLYDSDDSDEGTIDENTGAVLLFSGSTGEQLSVLGGELWGDRFGFQVVGLGDRDGDQVGDYLIAVEKAESAAGVKNAGRIQIVSSAGHEQGISVDGPGWDAHFGSSLAAMGDVDQDGVEDFVGGAFMYAANDEQYFQRGAAGIVSGRTGEVLMAWQGGTGGDRLGASVANLGDVDGDGIDDLALGAPQTGFVSDYTGAGYVVIKSGLTGKEISRIEGDILGGQMGWCLAPASDWDGDGANDLWVGAPSSITVGAQLGVRGRLYLVSGRTGRILHAIQGFGIDDQFGTSVCEIGDLNGDGLPEVLVGAPENVQGQTDSGYAVVISGKLFGSLLSP